MNRTPQRAAMVAAFWKKDLQANDWYKVNAADDDGRAEIRIYDVIGWPFVEADQFLSDLSAIQADQIRVRINSPGGDVFDGTAIYNALADHPAKITTSVEGIAASMASIIALAGDEREIYKNAHYMIHNPWTFTWGDYNDLQKEADLLKRIGATMAQTYAEKTGKSQQEIQSWMDDETWFIGQEAVDNGFATAIAGTGSASARFDLSVFAHAPQAAEPTKKNLERILTRDAGMTRSQALQLLQGGFESVGMSDSGDDHTGAIETIDKILETIHV